MRKFLAALLLALWSVPAFAQLGPGGSSLGPSGGGSGGSVPAGSLAVGVTAITGGTTTRVIYDNGGLVGEYTNTQLTALINPATSSLSGALPAFPGNTTTFFRGDGAYTALNLAAFPTQVTNTVLGNATSGTAVPTALAVGTCSTASSALIWTTNTGFGCNTSITASAVAVGGITGLGTSVATALGVNVGTAGAFVVNGGALGTPSSGTLSSATGLPVSTGISGLGTGVATALGTNVGSAGAPVTFNGALGTPSSGTLTNATGLPTAGILDANVTNAKLANMATTTIKGQMVGGSGAPVDLTAAQSASVTSAGKAKSQGSAASPSGTSSATLVMMGVAGSFTPLSTGNASITGYATLQTNTNGDGCLYSLRIGSGTAPTNGAASTGTQVNPQDGAVIMSASSAALSASLTGYVTGLSAGTTYWLDIALAAITGGTCTPSRIGIVAIEQ